MKGKTCCVTGHRDLPQNEINLSLIHIFTEDGQVAVVENGEAGHGFTNEAYRGNLKITKDSSDGRKDGFAIAVKSADGSYCETFTLSLIHIFQEAAQAEEQAAQKEKGMDSEPPKTSKLEFTADELPPETKDKKLTHARRKAERTANINCSRTMRTAIRCKYFYFNYHGFYLLLN